jgi:hypothetical protein
MHQQHGMSDCWSAVLRLLTACTKIMDQQLNKQISQMEPTPEDFILRGEDIQNKSG